MMWRRRRLALVLLGDRLVVAAIRGSHVETLVVDSEQPATTLRAEIDQRRLAIRGVALGLPRSAVTVKPIELPDVGGELRDMVHFELERHLPFTSDDASFDFIPLPAEAAGPATANAGRRVLIAAADRKVVEAALRLAEEARLRPVALSVAIHDLVTLVGSRHRGHVVWLHRVGEQTSLLFLTGGQLVLSRSVPSIDDGMLALEIQRSLAVARWTGIDEVWLSGDGAATGAPTTSALTAFGAPVTPPPFAGRARSLVGQITDAEPGAAQLAIAVALSSARRARSLDLLPLRLRPRRLTRQQIATMGAAAAAVILAVTWLLVPGYRESRRLTQVNRRIAELDGPVRAVEQTLQELERKRRLLATIKSLETTALRPLPVLRELTDLIPSDAWLTTLSLDTKGVELTGQAGAASALIPVLENSPRFERVEFSSPVTRGRDKEQFRIKTAWEEAPPAPGADKPPAARDAQRPPAGRDQEARRPPEAPPRARP